MRNAKRISVILLFLIVCCSLSAVSSTWFYDSLNAKQQSLYNRIGEAVLACKEELKDVGYDGNECLRIYLGYLDDHPGVFWVEKGIKYGAYIENGVTKYSIVFKYTHQDSLKADQTRFINLVSKFSDYLKDDANDYIKLYHIYDYLASTIKYSTDYMDQSMWSVFFEGIGVCAGFARSFQYLALLEGIPSVVVHGWSRNADGTKDEDGSHLWVMAEVNGKWYHFDPTWGLNDNDDGVVDFTYFCRSRKRIELTHVINEDYPIPESGDDSMSYVHVRNRYLTVYSEKGMKTIIKKALKQDEYSFTVEFSSLKELRAARKSLIDDGGFYSILSDLGVTDVKMKWYIYDEMAYSLKLVLEKKK